MNYRLLAADTLATTEHQACNASHVTTGSRRPTSTRPPGPEPSTAKVRAWTHSIGLSVPDRGRLRPEVWQACSGRSLGFLRGSGL
jgi:hypothetical protein